MDANYTEEINTPEAEVLMSYSPVQGAGSVSVSVKEGISQQINRQNVWRSSEVTVSVTLPADTSSDELIVDATNIAYGIAAERCHTLASELQEYLLKGSAAA